MKQHNQQTETTDTLKILNYIVIQLMRHKLKLIHHHSTPPPSSPPPSSPPSSGSSGGGYGY